MAVTVHSGDIMSPASDTATFFAQAFEAGTYRQIDVLCHIFGFKHLELPSNIAASIDAPLIVGLDAEWYERMPHPITELGIASLDPRYAQCSANFMQHPLYNVYNMQVRHVRFIKSAHMVNGQLCEGHPEDFQFGHTRFVTKAEGQYLLKASFQQPNNVPFALNPHLPRPVIFVGHAVSNDIEHMHSYLNVDLNALGTIACMIDTQVLAQELGLVAAPTLISLKQLLENFNIKEQYLHNAGNDIGQTIIAAALMCHEHAYRGSALVNPSNQQAVDYLKTAIRHRCEDDIHIGGLSTIGFPRYCMRCEAKDHLTYFCPTPVECTKCAENPEYKYLTHTHTTAKCIYAERPRVVIPCEECTLSKDPKRWRKASTHEGKDCYFSSSSASESDDDEPQEVIFKTESVLKAMPGAAEHFGPAFFAPPCRYKA